jgi:hypothetical protein
MLIFGENPACKNPPGIDKCQYLAEIQSVKIRQELTNVNIWRKIGI